jgi:hypothetical protein
VRSNCREPQIGATNVGWCQGRGRHVPGIQPDGPCFTRDKVKALVLIRNSVSTGMGTNMEADPTSGPAFLFVQR